MEQSFPGEMASPCSEPMACSEPSIHRDEAFKSLLLRMSHKMSELNARELAFATECGVEGDALQVLKALREQGVFSPFSCTNLEEHLRKINRCDLADCVKEYMNAHPDGTPPREKRNVSMEERGCGPVRIPMKRSATVPAQPHSSQECTNQGPLVQQEQAMEASSELHVSSSHTSMHKGYSQMTSTPRRENDSHSLTSGLSNQEMWDDMERTPMAHSQPESSFVGSETFSARPRIVSTPSHRKMASYDHSTHSTCADERTNSSRMHSAMSQHSHGSQDRFISSSSANVSRESSFRSTSRPGSQKSITHKVVQMAHMALDIASSQMASQDTLESDLWYRSDSNSLSSLAHTFSDTSPFLSESEPEQFQTKKLSQSFHGRHSSHAPRSVKQRRPSAPPRYRGEDNTPDLPSRSSRQPLNPIRQQSDDEVFDADSTPIRRVEVSCGAERACEASDTARKQEIYAATLRTKKSRKVWGNVEQSENQSRISDATPRQSMISEATSEGTITCTSPRASIYGKESVLDLGESSTDAHELQKPTKPFHKEKSLLRRKFSFLKSKSRTATPSHSFSWKVSREDLIKPIWRHKEQRCVTRPSKFELDANLGKHNPKLSFILYPCGQFQDAEKAVTMAVRITISEKCPPLPPASKLHLALVMWDGEREGIEVNRRKVEEKLNTSMFYIYNLIDHDQLKLSRSKNFHLDFEVSCSGVQDCYSYV